MKGQITSIISTAVLLDTGTPGTRREITVGMPMRHTTITFSLQMGLSTLASNVEPNLVKVP